MFRGILRSLRSDDDVIRDAEADAPAVSRAVLRERHAALLARGKAVGLDPATLLLLLEVFGPLIAKLVERLLARLGG